MDASSVTNVLGRNGTGTVAWRQRRAGEVVSRGEGARRGLPGANASIASSIRWVSVP